MVIFIERTAELMSQHFLLTAAARPLSLRRIMTTGDDEAFALFKQCRWSDKEAICFECRGIVASATGRVMCSCYIIPIYTAYEQARFCMNRSRFDLATVEEWAYSTVHDDEFSQLEEEDPDWFEIAVGGACSLSDIFRFVSDPACQKRFFFAQQLVSQLCWVYRLQIQLPFHFSRLQGLMGREDYLKECAEQAAAIYERALLIEQMRISADPALQAFAKALLDHRHVRSGSSQEQYVDILRSLHMTVVPLFANR